MTSKNRVARLILSFFVLYFAVFVQPVLALDIPSFPSCLNPQGEVIANYSDGAHGIVGTTKEYRGSDKVYKLSDGRVTQCFCEANGRGIQTNWWKASSLSSDDIKILERSGWYYIPNGSVWGLDSAAYVARNYEYTCLAIGGSTLGTSSDSNSVGKVLGLASTGNGNSIYNLWLTGLVALTLGVWLKKISLIPKKS